MLTACLTQGACSAALLAGRPTVQRAVRAPTPASFPKLACRAAAESSQVTGMVFEPFSEVEPISSSITKASGSESFARTDFHPECEAAINEQANIEYNVSYIYHAMWAYFDRDNVGLPGLASWFKENSAEERGHAELLMEYNNKRGGKVQLQSIMAPMTEFGGPGDGDKGDALYAMELALSLEKLNFQKLRALQAVAEKHSDAQMSDFVESDLLAEQVDAVKEVATYVSQLRRVGKGHGVFHFDKTFR